MQEKYKWTATAGHNCVWSDMNYDLVKLVAKTKNIKVTKKKNLVEESAEIKEEIFISVSGEVCFHSLRF